MKCLLRTRCGCSRMIDYVSPHGHYIKVAMAPAYPWWLADIDAAPLPEAAQIKTRVFEFQQVEKIFDLPVAVYMETV